MVITMVANAHKKQSIAVYIDFTPLSVTTAIRVLVVLFIVLIVLGCMLVVPAQGWGIAGGTLPTICTRARS
jgi:hypothetical protein